MSLVETVRNRYDRDGLDGVWEWARKGEGAKEKGERFAAAAKFAGNRKRQGDESRNWDKIQRAYRDERDKWLKRASEHDGRKADWNGHKPVLGALGEKVVAKANSLGCIVTSTNDGGHTATSYHYRDLAIDFGTGDGRTGPKVALQEWLFDEYPESLELFGPDNVLCIDNGHPIVLGEGSDLETLHDTHTHWAHTA